MNPPFEHKRYENRQQSIYYHMSTQSMETLVSMTTTIHLLHNRKEKKKKKKYCNGPGSYQRTIYEIKLVLKMQNSFHC